MRDPDMVTFDLKKAEDQIIETNAALLSLCRKHGMPADTDLCLTWLDGKLSAINNREGE